MKCTCPNCGCEFYEATPQEFDDAWPTPELTPENIEAIKRFPKTASELGLAYTINRNLEMAKLLDNSPLHD